MPLVSVTDSDRRFLAEALAEAETSFAAGGIPVGAVLVREGEVIARGHNRSQQTNDPTSHGETDCLRNGGLQASYDATTLYTTLSPCMMCTGAVLFLGVPRIVIGEREHYAGDIDFLVARGLEVVLADDPACIALMRRITVERAAFWAKLIER
ncbi:MAG: nucleoside deaminase [Hyphomicrobiaceae bacterium]